MHKYTKWSRLIAHLYSDNGIKIIGRYSGKLQWTPIVLSIPSAIYLFAMVTNPSMKMLSVLNFLFLFLSCESALLWDPSHSFPSWNFRFFGYAIIFQTNLFHNNKYVSNIDNFKTFPLGIYTRCMRSTRTRKCANFTSWPSSCQLSTCCWSHTSNVYQFFLSWNDHRFVIQRFRLLLIA